MEEQVLPRHVGIIMDGNGRWAKNRGLSRKMGHSAGAQTFRKIVRHCQKRGIPYLTVYAFSTENWKRPQEEVQALLKLFDQYLDEVKQYADENVRLIFIGDRSVFTPSIQGKMNTAEEKSQKNTGMTLNVAFNYGGRAELVQAMQRIAKAVQNGALSPDRITEKTIDDFLYTHGQPDVDLIIRPSGEYRLSNFLIWQSAYAEYVFMDHILWPDFSAQDFDAALDEFSKRNRRFGAI